MEETSPAQAMHQAKGYIWRLVAIIAVAFLFILIIIINITAQPEAGSQVWDARTTTGELSAKNHYIMYTDLLCPYCDVFSRLIMENQEEFDQFIAENDILFEVRLTDYLYEGSDHQISRDAAEGAYCATREDKFWEYYHEAISSLWKDYHSKGIGSSKTAQPIRDMPDDYWLKIGHKVGLGEQFDNCVNNHESVDDIIANTKRTAQTADGMPYFKFNRFTTSGFDNNWGWEYVLLYLNAGLEK